MNADADLSATQTADLGCTLERLRTAWRARKPSLAQRADDLGRLRHAFARSLDAMDTLYPGLPIAPADDPSGPCSTRWR